MTVPATAMGGVPVVRVKLEGVSVAGFIAPLKVAVIPAFRATPVALSLGDVELTVGAWVPPSAPSAPGGPHAVKASKTAAVVRLSILEVIMFVPGVAGCSSVDLLCRSICCERKYGSF